jgi:signal transduction histidine kinase/CheY-like chemotaxis protein
VSLGVLPLFTLLWGNPVSFFTFWILLLNACGWGALAVVALSEFIFFETLNEMARDWRIYINPMPFNYSVHNIFRELVRRERALSIGTGKRRILSRQSLSQALDLILRTTYNVLPVDAAEISISDGENEQPFSTLRMGGTPLSNYEPNSDKVYGHSNDLMHEIMLTLSGRKIGSFRVWYRPGYAPTASDQSLLEILGNQAVLAAVNTQFSLKLATIRKHSEALMKAKTGFLATLSHEVRGPIGFLLNATELIEDGLYGDVNDGQKELLQMMKRSGSHLLDLMNDVLDFAKTESGKVTVERVHLDLNELLKDMIGVVRRQAEEKNHRLVLVPATDSPLIVCDKRHLRQILINLLTNAIKYTPNRGKIEIWAEVAKEENQIKILVRDNGVGIHVADRKRVFAPFQRLDHAYAKAQPGTGIGMSLTKSLVELNSGTIDFDSVPGEGTTFWVTLPSEVAGLPTDGINDEDDVQLDGKDKVLMLFADDRGERSVMKSYLTHIGFQVREILSSRGLKLLLEREGIDLALISGSMLNPEVEEMLETLRSLKTTSSVPVVTVSNEGMKWEVKQYLRAGVDRHLTKPVSFSQLGAVCCKTVHDDFVSDIIPRAILTKGVDKSPH